MDTSLLGEFAAKFMEEIADWEGTIREVLIVVDTDDGTTSTIAWSCTDDRGWVQKALMYEAIDRIDDEMHALNDESDE